jgi:hypothetical protein
MNCIPEPAKVLALDLVLLFSRLVCEEKVMLTVVVFHAHHVQSEDTTRASSLPVPAKKYLRQSG